MDASNSSLCSSGVYAVIRVYARVESMLEFVDAVIPAWLLVKTQKVVKTKSQGGITASTNSSINSTRA